MRADRLIRALELLVEERKFIKDDSFVVSEEIFEIITEFIEELYLLANVQELERRMAAFSSIDIESVREAIKLIESFNPIDYTLSFESGTERLVHVQQEMETIHSSLDEFDQIQKKHGKLEVLFRLEMILDSSFQEVLMSFDSSSKIYEPLIDLVFSKLSLVDDNECLIMWGRLKAQFSKDESRSGFKFYSDIFPDKFLNDPGSPNDARLKYAEFISKYKPLTVKKMIKEGYNSHPAGLAGVARIMAFCSHQDLGRITNLEMLLIRSLSRIVALSTSITYKDAKEIAKSIGAEPTSLIFEGEYFNSYKKVLENNRNTENYYQSLILNMKRGLEYVKGYSVQKSYISNALWAYKLGQEVIAPSRNTSLRKMKSLEISLQREICKFLVERGIISYGRSFGRSQIDLYSKENQEEDFVVEVKVHKTKINQNTLVSNLTQLQSYMDSCAQPRGILVIFNFTNDLVDCPRKWLKGRYWILAINLCEVPPNRRNRMLQIEEGTRKGALIICNDIKTKNLKQKIKPTKKKN